MPIQTERLFAGKRYQLRAGDIPRHIACMLHVERPIPSPMQNESGHASYRKDVSNIITAPDFTVSIRPGMPSLLVLDEAAVPSIYWQPSAPRLNRQGLLNELKEGADIKGVALSNPEPVLSVRTR